MMPLVRLSLLAASVGLIAMVLVSCDEVTPQSFVELVESSRTCEADEDCVLAGAGECTCASPVNRSAEEEVNEAALDVACENVTAENCAPTDNLRCEANRCVTDGAP